MLCNKHIWHIWSPGLVNTSTIWSLLCGLTLFLACPHSCRLRMHCNSLSDGAFTLSMYIRRRHGYTAGELFAQLAPEEFEQQGGMVAVALPSQAGATSVTAEIFGRCGPDPEAWTTCLLACFAGAWLPSCKGLAANSGKTRDDAPSDYVRELQHLCRVGESQLKEGTNQGVIWTNQKNLSTSGGCRRCT
jgi:hypothetical protein